MSEPTEEEWAADDAEVARLVGTGMFSFDIDEILSPERRALFEEMAEEESNAD